MAVDKSRTNGLWGNVTGQDFLVQSNTSVDLLVLSNQSYRPESGFRSAYAVDEESPVHILSWALFAKADLVTTEFSLQLLHLPTATLHPLHTQAAIPKINLTGLSFQVLADTYAILVYQQSVFLFLIATGKLLRREKDVLVLSRTTEVIVVDFRTPAPHTEKNLEQAM